jgi:hypothetical protein
MSSANLVALRYVAESTLGVTPASPALKQLRFLSESLNFSIQNTQSEEIRPDRAESDLIQTDAEAAGDINYELSFLTWDDFLQAVMCGTFSAVSGNITSLVNGILMRSFTIQKHFQDTTPNQYHTFRGCVVNTMSMTFQTGQILNGSFGIMSFGAAAAEAQIAGATLVAAPTTTPMNAVSNFQSFSIDGVPYSGCISSLSINIANNVRPIKCIGTLGANDMVLGTFEVTGGMDLYFREGSMYDKFLKGTEFSYNFKVIDDKNNSYTYFIPRAKFETGEVVAGGRNTDVMFRATWRGLYDGTAGHVIRIVKDPVG